MEMSQESALSLLPRRTSSTQRVDSRVDSLAFGLKPKYEELLN